MANIYYENDADMSLLEDKTIGVIGYGSQGHAHALNLHDSGLNVMVGLYEGSRSWETAESDGLKVGLVEETARESDVIMVLIPDHIQAEVYRESILPHLLPGKTLMFAHGFNIHYEWIVPPDSVDVSMVAPKAPGHRMREVYTRGSGVPGLLAVHQDVTGNAAVLDSPTREEWAAHAPVSWRPHSRKRQRPTCSESRRYCAAAWPNS